MNQTKLSLSLNLVETFESIDAELLPDLAPHLAGVATFAIFTPYHRHRFASVNNVETGLRIAFEDSKKAAIAKAKRRLAAKTPRDVIRAYRRAIRSSPCLRAEIERAA